MEVKATSKRSTTWLTREKSMGSNKKSLSRSIMDFLQRSDLKNDQRALNISLFQFRLELLKLFLIRISGRSARMSSNLKIALKDLKTVKDLWKKRF